MENKDNISSITESISQLMKLQEEVNDHLAAGLYRAMFRHEVDIDKLDNTFADGILSYAEMGCQSAIEDYRNYLQYLKTVAPSLYPEYHKMLEDALNGGNDD